jgi:glycosyltransferase involved in cell wall biosynthesis
MDRADSSDARPKVTVGMPVWNGERFLRQAIDSVLGQTHADLELVISDNASTDATPQICAAYAAQDARVRYVRSDVNRGAAWNYNRVFELARGDYFKWAAHDDWMAASLLARYVEVLDSDPGVVLCIAGTTIVDEHGQRIRELRYELALDAEEPSRRYRAFCAHFSRLENFHCNPVFGLIRADVLRQTPRIGAYWGSDAVLLGELALRGRFHRLDDNLFFRRDHAERALSANSTPASVTAWFDPRKSGPWRFPRWRCLYEHARSIARAPMSVRERLACWGALLRSTRWRLMARDVRNVARALRARRARSAR